MEYTVSLDDQTYTDLYQTYKDIGDNLQSALDALLNEISTMITNGTIEGPAVAALQDIETTARQNLQQRIPPLTLKRGLVTTESVYSISTLIDS